MCEGLVIPGTDKEIMEILIKEYRYTTRRLAEVLKVDMHTVQNLLAGKNACANERIELIALYVDLTKKRLKVFYN